MIQISNEKNLENSANWKVKNIPRKIVLRYN